jgi:transposase
MQKALVQMNIQLTEVLSDVMGMTGQAIIRDIVAGQRDPQALARHRSGRIKASAEEVRKALTGNWREEHLFVLTQALAMYDSLAQRIGECDAKTQALLAPLGRQDIDLGKAPKERSKQRAAFDVRQALANWAGVDLTRIDGLGVAAVMKILSEIGPDLSRFANVKHFCSWLGLCPGTKISGGKVLSANTKRSANRARQALKMAAMSLSRSDSALGAFYRRLCGRMDKPRANHGRRPQARAHDLLHADARRGLCRQGAATLRTATTPAQHRSPKASRRHSGIQHLPVAGKRMKTGSTEFVSQERGSLRTPNK